MVARSAPYEVSDEGVRWRLHRNEAPLPAPPHVLRAIRALDPDAVRWYPANAQRDFARRLADRLAVDSDRLVLANGADEILCALARTCARPGDAIAFPDPSFAMYERAAQLAGARPVGIPYTKRWSLALDDVRSNVNDRTRLLLLGNPNNPTAESIAYDFIVTASRERPSTVVAVDEVYLAFSERSLLTRLLPFENVVTIGSFSKAAGLAGLRIGYAVAEPSLAAALREQVTPFPLSAPSIAGAVEYLRDERASRAYEVALRAQVERSLDAIEGAALPHATHVWRGAANFILLELPSAAAVAERLAQRGIAIRRFEHPALRSCIRVSAADDTTTDAFIRALPEIMREVRDA